MQISVSASLTGGDPAAPLSISASGEVTTADAQKVADLIKVLSTKMLDNSTPDLSEL